MSQAFDRNKSEYPLRAANVLGSVPADKPNGKDGPPGVGKSHLATAIGVKACLPGYSVIFATIQHLASQLTAAMADLSVERLVDQYARADLIVLDELGFIPLK